jgi:hypothetical protein
MQADSFSVLLLQLNERIKYFYLQAYTTEFLTSDARQTLELYTGF